MAIQIDVVVVVIDRVREMLSFTHFVGMLVGSCFKARGYYHAHKFSASNLVSSHYLSYWKLMSKPDPYTSSLSYMSKHHYRPYSRV